jgi:hypothetical protein
MRNITVSSSKRLAKVSLRFSRGDAVLLAIAIYVFWISLIIAPYHVNGDQVHYTKAYNAMRGLGLVEALDAYRGVIFSFEPVHFFISWVFVNLGFEKIVAMAGLNSFLAVLFGRFLLGRTQSLLIVVLLVASNPYIYAMFFTLEKLKISVIFFLLFLNYKAKILGILAVFAHLQIGLLFAIYFASRFFSRLRFSIFRKLLHPRNFLRMLISALIAIVGVLAFYNYGLSKIYFYMNRDGIGSLTALFPTLVIFTLTLITTDQNRTEVSWYFAIMALVILLIGGDRVNMFVFFGFLYFTSYRIQASLNGIVFLSTIFISTLYLGYKSYSYLDLIVNHGG